MTVKKHSDFALLVHACDRYRFLYEGFYTFFKKYKGLDIPCNFYFATEDLKVDLDGFINIRSGKGEWSDRLAKLLRDEIKEQYLIYFQEDMWLSKPIDPVFFDGLFTLMETHQWKQVKLTSSDVYQTEATTYEAAGFTIAKLDNERSGYLMSHQVTVWDKDFLLAQLLSGEHPWRNERKGTKRLKKLNPEIYQADYFAENGHPEININPDPACRSAYNTVSQNSVLNDRVLPYITELRSGRAQEETYAAQLQQHYDEQLTHDGLPKPRKDDVFKKIKNWVKGK